MKGAQAVASILKKEGAEYLFCFPANPVIDPAAEVDIRPIMARTERTAVAMADGYARVSNGDKVAAVAVQSGPGAENAFGGVAQAYSDSSPILVIAGQAAQSRIGQDPNFDAILSYREITKWRARFNSVDRIPGLMRRAFTYLRNGRPGPVLLEIPADIGDAQFGEKLDYSPVQRTRTMADPVDVSAAVKAILSAKKGLIHAGQGVLYAHATEDLVELAELLQMPVMSTLPGKSVFPENHPLSLGTGGNTGLESLAQYLKEADLVFGIGASLTSTYFAAPIPAGKVIVQATVDERDLNKDYPATHILMGDAKLLLRQVIEESKKQMGSARRPVDAALAEMIRRGKDASVARYLPKLTSEAIPMNPYRVIWELKRLLDPGKTIITHDAGTPRDMLAPFWTTVNSRGYIGWGKSSHLGYGLGLAMGAKLAAPDKLCMNLMGDGAFGMIGMEMETAVRNKIGTLTILLNNSCLGGYDKNLPVSSRKFGTRFMCGNYMMVAQGLGAYSERVEKPEEIAPALQRAVRATEEGRPALLEMITGEETELSRYWS